jgi:hypothetical protein
MPILDNIKSFFSRKKSQVEVLDVTSEEIQPHESLENNALTIAEDNNFMEVVGSNQPDWLMNEDILRDEGVIFGLSNSDPEEKRLIIRSYFAQKTADTDKFIEQEEEKIGELNYWINENESFIKDFEGKIHHLKNQEFTQQHHLPRTIVGTLLALGIAIGNYFLIEESLRGQFEQSRLIAMGVFFMGMFSLFGRVSLLHDDEKETTWRKLLEEIGMPLASAFFVFAQSYQNLPLLKSLSLFAFIFFLFLFAGKLLLGNLTVLKDDLSIYQKRNQLQKDKVKKVEEWEAQIEKLETEIETHRSDKQSIMPKLTKLSAYRAKINAHRDMLIKIFESEYNLARNYQHKLTKNS